MVIGLAFLGKQVVKEFVSPGLEKPVDNRNEKKKTWKPCVNLHFKTCRFNKN